MHSARGDMPVVQAGVGIVTGTITGSKNEPKAGVSVKIMKMGDVKKPHITAPAGEGEVIASGTTDAAGKFTINNVPVGTYRVVAGDRISGAAYRWVKITEGQTVSVTLKIVERNDGLGN